MAQANVKITANTSEYRNQMRQITSDMKGLSKEYSLASTKAKLLGNSKEQLKIKAQDLTRKMKAKKDKIQINSQ